MIWVSLQLIFNQLPSTIPDFDHALDAVLCGDGQFHLVHDGVLTVVDLSIYDGKAEVANTRVGRDALCNAFFRFFHLLQFCNLSMDIGKRVR